MEDLINKLIKKSPVIRRYLNKQNNQQKKQISRNPYERSRPRERRNMNIKPYLTIRDFQSLKVRSQYLPNPIQIITFHLNSLEHMRNFLIKTEFIYRNACGNFLIFRRDMILNKLYIFLRILIGVTIPTEYVTQDYWDSLAFHLLCAWAMLYGLNYQSGNLISVIKEIKQIKGISDFF